MKASAALITLSVVFASSALACLGADATATFTPSLPERATFAPVSHAFERSCGSIDCHGTPVRNFRVYGAETMRLSPADKPLSPASSTDPEISETYASLVGLEPEILSSVVAAHGAQPERLTVVRKARGTEHHKGGSVVPVGGPFDRCLTSWLAGALDDASCKQAAPPL